MAALAGDILAGYTYQVFFDGQAGAGFADCGGLESAVALNSVRVVTLHRGVLVTREFFDWVMQHSVPHNLRLTQLDELGQERRSWALVAARLSKVTATTFTGNGFPFRVEALELTVERVIA